MKILPLPTLSPVAAGDVPTATQQRVAGARQPAVTWRPIGALLCGACATCDSQGTLTPHLVCRPHSFPTLLTSAVAGSSPAATRLADGGSDDTTMRTSCTHGAGAQPSRNTLGTAESPHAVPAAGLALTGTVLSSP